MDKLLLHGCSLEGVLEGQVVDLLEMATNKLFGIWKACVEMHR